MKSGLNICNKLLHAMFVWLNPGWVRPISLSAAATSSFLAIVDAFMTVGSQWAAVHSGLCSKKPSSRPFWFHLVATVFSASPVFQIRKKKKEAAGTVPSHSFLSGYSLLLFCILWHCTLDSHTDLPLLTPSPDKGRMPRVHHSVTVCGGGIAPIILPNSQRANWSSLTFPQRPGLEAETPQLFPKLDTTSQGEQTWTATETLSRHQDLMSDDLSGRRLRFPIEQTHVSPMFTFINNLKNCLEVTAAAEYWTCVLVSVFDWWRLIICLGISGWACLLGTYKCWYWAVENRSN